MLDMLPDQRVRSATCSECKYEKPPVAFNEDVADNTLPCKVEGQNELEREAGR